jgi:hypothetical protein
MSDLKSTDPKLCQVNMDQFKSYIGDRIQSKTDYLTSYLKQCDQELPKLTEQCLTENNYQNDCPVKKFLSSNNLESDKIGLTAEETKKTQEIFSGKIHRYVLFSINNKTIAAIVGKIGANNFIAQILIDGLQDKIDNNAFLPLNYQAPFLESATDKLAKRLEKENYKFDSDSKFKDQAQNFLTYDNKVSRQIISFKKMVLENVTSSKENNLVLIKQWAASQSLENTPLFEELAERIRPKE